MDCSVPAGEQVAMRFQRLYSIAEHFIGCPAGYLVAGETETEDAAGKYFKLINPIYYLNMLL